MEKLKVAHGAMKINPIVKDHAAEIGVQLVPQLL